jgi:hypothetical protein
MCKVPLGRRLFVEAIEIGRSALPKIVLVLVLESHASSEIVASDLRREPRWSELIKHSPSSCLLKQGLEHEHDFKNGFSLACHRELLSCQSSDQQYRTRSMVENESGDMSDRSRADHGLAAIFGAGTNDH